MAFVIQVVVDIGMNLSDLLTVFIRRNRFVARSCRRNDRCELSTRWSATAARIRARLREIAMLGSMAGDLAKR